MPTRLLRFERSEFADIHHFSVVWVPRRWTHLWHRNSQYGPVPARIASSSVSVSEQRRGASMRVYKDDVRAANARMGRKHSDRPGSA